MTLFSPPRHHRAAAQLRVWLRPAAAATATAAILWGTMGPVAALYPSGSALAVSEMRLAIGAVALGLAALTGQGQAARWQRREIPAVVVGIVSVAGYSVLYFPAVELAGVASATVVAIGAAPLVAGLGHVLAGRGPLSRTWLVTTVVATAGIGLVVLPGALTSHSRVGIVLAFAAACCYALQAHSIHTLTGRHSPTMTVAVLFAGAAVLLCPLLPRGVALVSGSLPALAGVVYLGLFTTAAAYALFAFGVRGTSAPTAVTLSLLEPVVAAVLGAGAARAIRSARMACGSESVCTGTTPLAARSATCPRLQTRQAWLGVRLARPDQIPKRRAGGTVRLTGAAGRAGESPARA